MPGPRARRVLIGFAAPLSVVAFVLASAATESSRTEEQERALLYAEHRDEDGRFFTPWAESARSAWRIVQWTLSPSPYSGRDAPLPGVVPNDGAYLARPDAADSVTWVGHSTFAIQDGGDVVLTDPHFTKRALLPARHQAPGIPVESVPAQAAALISHNHYDHLDAYSVALLPKDLAWFVPLGLADWFRERGRENVVELDWWQSAQHGRWNFTCLPSQHWSRRVEQSENESLWCSWLITSPEHTYYFAGDTGYFSGFKEFGRKFPDIDVALMPIGAYAPRWFMSFAHMDPAQSLQAFRDLGAKSMIGMHWGTFDLTDEPVGYAAVELREVLDAAPDRAELEARVHVMDIGERRPTAELLR